MPARISRRSLLSAAGALGGVTAVGGLPALVERLCAQGACGPLAPAGELIGVVPLHGDRVRTTPFGTLVGGPGLDARQFTDLSKLAPDRLITPSAEVFIRTAAPPALRTTPAAWSIALDGGGRAAPALTLDRLLADAAPMGAHLIECSGNADPDNFGLMSVAEWDGVPLAAVVDRIRPRGAAAGVLIGGVDDMSQASRSSSPGASWIIPLDAIERLGAFLAVGMNGQPLTPDHGAPVRLVVPGWYGCSWIKWVDRIALVEADARATSQMVEFATRTHQEGRPLLAREHDAPAIDLAATPVRVEKRRVDGRLEYRVVGIVWGGDRPVNRLMIRFRAGEPPQAVAVCPPPKTHRTWSLWESRWRPPSPGVYTIALRAADPAIRTRRLDVSYYARRVVIDET